MTKSKDLESKVIIEYTHIACSMSDAEDGKGREMTRTGTAMTAPARKKIIVRTMLKKNLKQLEI